MTSPSLTRCLTLGWSGQMPSAEVHLVPGEGHISLGVLALGPIVADLARHP